MEKTQFETASFMFSSRSHRHLKSETYRTLVRILSHCYDHSQVSAAQEPRPEMCEKSDLVGPNCLVSEHCGHENDTDADQSFEAVGLEDKGFSDTPMVIDGIARIMEVEENEDLLKQTDLDACGSADGTGSKDMVFDQQQMVMDELEHIVRGSAEVVRENGISFSTAPMDENQGGVVVLMKDREEHVDVGQIVNEEFGKESQLQLQKRHCNLRIPEPVDSSVDRSMDCQISEPSENSEGRYSLVSTNALEVEHEMQQKEVALDNLDHTDNAIDSRNCVAGDVEGDVEVEEGEISGGFEVDEALIDMLFDDAVVSEEKKNEKQVCADVIDKRELSSNEQNKASETFFEPTSFIVNHANSGRAMELKESVRNEKQCQSRNFVHGASMMATDVDRYNSVLVAGRNKRKSIGGEESVGIPAVYLNNPTTHGETLEQSVTEKQGITSEEKLDSGACNKKKRSAPSKERKAKKKQKERKKRAEKNRQLGVKRLKLRPVLKPKTITYCRHYLMGRCQEGDKCKFSHDTIPLTKSKPCCHFARNSCMKGDDCQFDHQLSKYTCNNFAAKGFCNRADVCMFSHKMLPKEDAQSASSASKHELKLPLHISNSQKQVNVNPVSHQNVDALSNSGKVTSCKITEQNVAPTVLKPPALAPKGISCFFLGKSSLLESSKLKQGSSSPMRNDSGQVGNQIEQTAFCTVQNMNETPERTPSAVAPKGVNFLSFGNSPVTDSSSQKLASLLLNRENAVKPSLLNNFNVNKQVGSSNNGESIDKVGKQTTQSVSSAVEKSNEILKKTHPTLTPKGLNFPSMRKALIDDTISNEQASLPSSSDKGINRSLQGSQNVLNEHQNSTAIPRRPSASPLAAGHSTGPLGHGHCKNIQNSSQKALMSTLAFAAKIEPARKINLSAVSTGANDQTSNNGIGSDAAAGSSGGSLNDSMKASRILEFLSGFGKRKQ